MLNDAISMFVHVPSFDCNAILDNIADFRVSRKLIVDCSGKVVYFKFEVRYKGIQKPYGRVFKQCVRLPVRTENCSLSSYCVLSSLKDGNALHFAGLDSVCKLCNINQTEVFTQEKGSTATGLLWNTNMSSVSMCRK